MLEMAGSGGGKRKLGMRFNKLCFSGGLKTAAFYRNASRTGNHQKYFQITHDPPSHTGMCIRNWGEEGIGGKKERLVC